MTNKVGGITSNEIAMLLVLSGILIGAGMVARELDAIVLGILGIAWSVVCIKWAV